MVASNTVSSVAAPSSVSSHVEVRVKWAVISLATICSLWAGMLMGIVLQAAVRSQTPTLTRPVSMDVGRVVFSAFGHVELIWCVVAVLLMFAVRPFARFPRLIGGLLLLSCAIAIFQYFALLPMLVERAQMIVSGRVLPPSPVHGLYTSTSLIKLISLISCSVLSIKALIPSDKK